MSIRRLSYPLLALAALAATPFLVAATSGGAGSATAAVACGDTVTQNVTLTADLSCGSGDGIDVNANGVTVNLNGHTIDGGGSATGVDVLGHTGVTVENGLIKNFDFGVFFENGSDGGKVVNVHLTSLGTAGIDFNGSDNALITKNVVSVAGGGAGDGIFVTSGQGLKLVSNFVDEVAGVGILVENEAAATVTGNKSLNNTSFGIRLTGSTTGTLSGNVSSSNGSSGILLDLTLGSFKDVVTVSKNRAAFNATFGMVGSAPATVDGGGNVVQDNGTAAQCQDFACVKVAS